MIRLTPKKFIYKNGFFSKKYQLFYVPINIFSNVFTLEASKRYQINQDIDFFLPYRLSTSYQLVKESMN